MQLLPNEIDSTVHYTCEFLLLTCIENCSGFNESALIHDFQYDRGLYFQITKFNEILLLSKLKWSGITNLSTLYDQRTSVTIYLKNFGISQTRSKLKKPAQLQR